MPSHLYSQYAVTAVDAYGNESAFTPIAIAETEVKSPDSALSAEERIKKVRKQLVGKK
jgi:hypothetical protein